jgi:hypothetical protein
MIREAAASDDHGMWARSRFCCRTRTTLSDVPRCCGRLGSVASSRSRSHRARSSCAEHVVKGSAGPFCCKRGSPRTGGRRARATTKALVRRHDTFLGTHTIDGGAATVLVVEDVHWADDASLDALAFVARRIEELRAMLVLTNCSPPSRRGCPHR